MKKNGAYIEMIDAAMVWKSLDLQGSSKSKGTKETFIVAKWKVLEFCFFPERVLLKFLLYILKRFLFIFFFVFSIKFTHGLDFKNSFQTFFSNKTILLNRGLSYIRVLYSEVSLYQTTVNQLVLLATNYFQMGIVLLFFSISLV